jgi:FAD synthase
MEIQFIQKIRDETKFVSTRFLIRQIKKDILLAKKILSRH